VTGKSLTFLQYSVRCYLKYLMPRTVPSFLPSWVSNSTPAHIPVANSVVPQNLNHFVNVIFRSKIEYFLREDANSYIVRDNGSMVLKVLSNEKRGGLKVATFGRSPFKLFSLKFSAKSVQALSCERLKTTQRTLFLLFANNNCFPITL
jgi:hypothetical protein